MSNSIPKLFTFYVNKIFSVDNRNFNILVLVFYNLDFNVGRMTPSNSPDSLSACDSTFFFCGCLFAYMYHENYRSFYPLALLLKASMAERSKALA